MRGATEGTGSKSVLSFLPADRNGEVMSTARPSGFPWPGLRGGKPRGRV